MILRTCLHDAGHLLTPVDASALLANCLKTLIYLWKVSHWAWKPGQGRTEPIDAFTLFQGHLLKRQGDSKDATCRSPADKIE